MILRDNSGRRTGSVEEGYNGRKTVRDNQYRTLYRIEEGYGDRLIIRDKNGLRTGTVEPQ